MPDNNNLIIKTYETSKIPSVSKGQFFLLNKQHLINQCLWTL